MLISLDSCVGRPCAFSTLPSRLLRSHSVWFDGRVSWHFASLSAGKKFCGVHLSEACDSSHAFCGCSSTALFLFFQMVKIKHEMKYISCCAPTRCALTGVKWYGTVLNAIKSSAKKLKNRSIHMFFQPFYSSLF